MPLNINSCLCRSALSIDSVVDASPTSQHSTQQIHSLNDYAISSTNVKALDIKPRETSLNAKLRMSAKEYMQYKELMGSIERLNKKIQHDDLLFMNESSSLEMADAKITLTPSNALDDDDTDFVPFEEFEAWRLQRLKYPVTTIPFDFSSDQTNKQTKGAAFPVNQGISSDYDIPRKQTTSIDYDIPIRRKTVENTEEKLIFRFP